MIPYDIDPSLHNTEPESAMLDDGFSPPHCGERAATAEQPPPALEAAEPGPAEGKSPF
jgi:hypothetical protein